MGDANIAIKVGSIEFSGQGEQGWVADQLDKILAKAEELMALAGAGEAAEHENGLSDGGHKPMGADSEIGKRPLPTFLSEKNAAKNQTKKFLATAVWLEAKGTARLTTGDVSKALKDSNQSRLGNPSQCLNDNVSKGYCEKDGKQFFVTQEGKVSL